MNIFIHTFSFYHVSYYFCRSFCAEFFTQIYWFSQKNVYRVMECANNKSTRNTWRLRDHKESKKEKILFGHDLADKTWGPFNIT